MHALTPAGERAVEELAQRYRVSTGAVRTLLVAVAAGGGTMAQFQHPELGGSGQWMRGGMTMVGDMFNHGLQATVSGLCAELSSLLASQPLFAPLPSVGARQGGGPSTTHGHWWPAELGTPSTSGAQNDVRYAYFPATRRLALSRQGQLFVYDTLDHRIGGVQQQQGGGPSSLSFSSQHGTFAVDSLPQLSPPPASAASAPSAPTKASAAEPVSLSGAPRSSDEVIGAIERLATLHQKGILSEEEFRTKKAELLSRL